ALVAVMELGVSGATIPRVLPRGLRPAVPGRVERVADRPRCIVDIAYVPQRLERVVTQLRRSTKGRLYVVVGARGDHTPEERRAASGGGRTGRGALSTPPTCRSAWSAWPPSCAARPRAASTSSSAHAATAPPRSVGRSAARPQVPTSSS